MDEDFDVEELEKLPPAQRLSKIKELKQKLQNKIEQEAEKLEEESKHDLEEQQRQVNELLHRRIEEETSQQEEVKSQLEETVKKTLVEKKEIHQIDYSKSSNSEYVVSEPISINSDPFTKDIRGKKLQDMSPYNLNKDYI